MSITYVASGASVAGTGAVVPAIPAGVAAGDLLLLLCETANEPVAAPSGWSEAPASPAGVGAAAGTSSVAIYVFFRIFQAGVTAPTVADPGNHVVAFISAFRGVNANLPFLEATSGTTTNQTITPTALSIPLQAGTFILTAVATLIDSNTAQYNTSQRGLLADGYSNVGNGGGVILTGSANSSEGGPVWGTVTLGSSQTVAFWHAQLRTPKDLTGNVTSRGLTVSELEVLSELPTAKRALAVDVAPIAGLSEGEVVLTAAFNWGSSTVPTVPAGWDTLESHSSPSGSAVLAKRMGPVVQNLSPEVLNYAPPGVGLASNSTSVMLDIYDAAAKGAGVFVSAAVAGLWTSSNPDDPNSWVQTLAGGGGLHTSYTGTQSIRVNRVMFGNGIFLAIVGTSSVYTSPDGYTWTFRTTLGGSIRNIACNGTIWIVLREDYTTIHRTADNGATWTQHSTPVLLGRVAAGQGAFIGPKHQPSPESPGVMLRSTDGISWNTHNLPSDQTSQGVLAFYQTTYINYCPGLGRWYNYGLRNGGGGTAQWRIWTSTNGTTWSNGDISFLTNVSSFIFFHDDNYIYFYPAAGTGNSQPLYRTTDCTNWTLAAPTCTRGQGTVIWDEGRFLLFCGLGPYRCDAIDRTTFEITYLSDPFGGNSYAGLCGFAYHGSTYIWQQYGTARIFRYDASTGEITHSAPDLWPGSIRNFTNDGTTGAVDHSAIVTDGAGRWLYLHYVKAAYSLDDGQTWAPIVSSMFGGAMTQARHIAVSNGTFFINGSTNNTPNLVFRTTNFVDFIDTGLTGVLQIFSHKGAIYAIGSVGGNRKKSVDGGISWQNLAGSDSAGWYGQYSEVGGYLYRTNGSTGVGRYARTTDYETVPFTDIPQVETGNASGLRPFIDPITGDIAILARTGNATHLPRILVSSDGGESWYVVTADSPEQELRMERFFGGEIRLTPVIDAFMVRGFAKSVSQFVGARRTASVRLTGVSTVTATGASSKSNGSSATATLPGFTPAQPSSTSYHILGTQAAAATAQDFPLSGPRLRALAPGTAGTVAFYDAGKKL